MSTQRDQNPADAGFEDAEFEIVAAPPDGAARPSHARSAADRDVMDIIALTDDDFADFLREETAQPAGPAERPAGQQAEPAPPAGRNDQLQLFRKSARYTVSHRRPPDSAVQSGPGALSVALVMIVSTALGAMGYQVWQSSTGQQTQASAGAALPTVSIEKTASIDLTLPATGNAATGPAALPSADGFVLGETRFSVTERDGRQVLVIGGTITNRNRATAPVPDLTFAYRQDGTPRTMTIRRGESLEQGRQLGFKHFVPLQNGVTYDQTRLAFEAR